MARYTSVSEMVMDLTEDKEFAKEVCDTIAARTIISSLMALRATKGLTVSEMAVKLGWTRARLAKLESGVDEKLTIDSINQYAMALGYKPILSFQKV